MASDNFYLRAVVAGICVGIGEDSYYFYGTYIAEAFGGIQRWMNTGGGDLEYN